MSQLLLAACCVCPCIVHHFIVAQSDAYKARLTVLLACRLAGHLDREAAGSRVAVAWASALFMAPVRRFISFSNLPPLSPKKRGHVLQ